MHICIVHNCTHLRLHFYVRCARGQSAETVNAVSTDHRDNLGLARRLRFILLLPYLEHFSLLCFRLVVDVLLTGTPTTRVPWLDPRSVQLVNLAETCQRTVSKREIVTRTSSSVSPTVSGINRYVYTHPKSNMPKKMSRMSGPIFAAIRGDQKLSKKFQTQSAYPVSKKSPRGLYNTDLQQCPTLCTSVAHVAGNSPPSTPCRAGQSSFRSTCALGKTHQGVGPQNAPYVKTCMIAKAIKMSPPCLLRSVS